MINLGAIDGTTSAGFDINDGGKVVGQTAAGTRGLRPFLWHRGVMKEIPIPSSFGPTIHFSNATAVNDSGMVAGFIFGKSMPGGFRYQHGQIATPKINGAFGFRDVNESGQVVGTLSLSATTSEAFILNLDGRTVELPATLRHGFTSAHAINDHGDLAGAYQTPAEPRVHAFRLRNGQVQDLGLLAGGGYSYPADINNAGTIVGYADAPPPGGGFAQHAFISHDGNTMTDLNALLPAGSGWTLESAQGINDRGEIVGSGIHNGVRRAFLLTNRR
jgi:probable HAF family extracellular repeat protein